MNNTAQYDVTAIRNDFPILGKKIHGKPLVYLDNAASSQHPVQVINAVKELYESGYSNIHRGVHQLSQDATKAYENARASVRGFIHADCMHEVVFTSGTTASINLVAQSYARPLLKKGDEILITHMEHHSNIVPWQIVCEQTGAILKVVPISDKGELELDRFAELLSEKTKLVSVAHVSNALGTVNPIKTIIDMAHAKGVPVLVDGAQAIPHIPVDVHELDCDFYAFSGHKIYGPTGIGVLYGKEKLLNAMPPYQGGGDMILSVSFAGTTYNMLPYKFEAGTPNIAGAIGMGAAIEYVQKIGLGAIVAHEHGLLEYATSKLRQIDGLRIIGEAKQKAGLVSFVLDCVHPHDIGTMLDAEGVAIRTGHHCAQPVMERFKVPATARASFALYNTFQEIDVLAEAIVKTIGMFR
jgi:cysteine desulfurase/selenocysteine lyase